jgi:hypothetical protein
VEEEATGSQRDKVLVKREERMVTAFPTLKYKSEIN